MEFEDFDVEFRRVLDSAEAGLSTAALRAEIERLRELADSIENSVDREAAGHDIAMLDDLVAHDDDPPPSAAMTEAFGAYSAAAAAEGTAAERIARAQRGIEEISRIAAKAHPDEQASILGMNESLYMLIGALQPDVR